MQRQGAKIATKTRAFGEGDEPKGAFYEKWYAVGLSRIRCAEAAVCALPETKPTDLVVALRKLTPVENCCNRRGPSADCFVDQWKRRSSTRH
jgi:hypothetical protein